MDFEGIYNVQLFKSGLYMRVSPHYKWSEFLSSDVSFSPEKYLQCQQQTSSCSETSSLIADILCYTEQTFQHRNVSDNSLFLTVIVSESRKRGRNLKSRKSRNQDRGDRDCRKEKYRDYYIEPNGCRSVKPYKMSNCVGSDNCGAVKSR